MLQRKLPFVKFQLCGCANEKVFVCKRKLKNFTINIISSGKFHPPRNVKVGEQMQPSPKKPCQVHYNALFLALKNQTANRRAVFLAR